jgi:hypothetical protein
MLIPIRSIAEEKKKKTKHFQLDKKYLGRCPASFVAAVYNIDVVCMGFVAKGRGLSQSAISSDESNI